MNDASFPLFLLAALVIAAVPGPGIFYVAARTLAGGSKAGIASTFGTAVGGLVDAVEDGVTGVLVAARDPHGLREALRRLVGDAGERRQLGAAGRRFAGEHWTLGVTAESLRECYASLLVE